MSLSDEILMAYADDEADEATRRDVEAAMRDDPEVAARVARHRALRAVVSGAFSSVIEEPIPERLLSAARQRPVSRRDNVVSLVRSGGPPIWARPPSWRPYALAASLLIGISIGYGIWHDSGSLMSDGARGGWVARGGLSRALSEQLASDRPAGSVATIGLSYLTKSGVYCRTFSLTRSASVGVACHEGDEWQLKVLDTSPAVPDASPEYRAASSATSPAIRATVEGAMQGDALDRASEIAAQKRGWRISSGP